MGCEKDSGRLWEIWKCYKLLTVTTIQIYKSNNNITTVVKM